MAREYDSEEVIDPDSTEKTFGVIKPILSPISHTDIEILNQISKLCTNISKISNLI